MFTFDLTKLNGYDWYLIGLFRYDYNYYNMYYVLIKAAMFNVETLPMDELQKAGEQFLSQVNAYLSQGQREIEQWIDNQTKPDNTPVQLPPDDLDIKQLFKDLTKM